MSARLMSLVLDRQQYRLVDLETGEAFLVEPDPAAGGSTAKLSPYPEGPGWGQRNDSTAKRVLRRADDFLDHDAIPEDLSAAIREVLS